MVNCTTDIMAGCVYNLSRVFNNDIIDNPGGWFAKVNEQMNGIVVISLLAVIGVVLFVLMREVGKGREDFKDSTAALYASFIVSMTGLFLFLVQTGVNSLEGTTLKILSWEQELVLLVITAIFLGADWYKRRH